MVVAFEVFVLDAVDAVYVVRASAGVSVSTAVCVVTCSCLLLLP